MQVSGDGTLKKPLHKNPDCKKPNLKEKTRRHSLRRLVGNCVSPTIQEWNFETETRLKTSLG